MAFWEKRGFLIMKNFCFPAYWRQSFMTYKADSHLATDRKVPRFEFKPCDGVSSLSKIKVVMSQSVHGLSPPGGFVSPQENLIICISYIQKKNEFTIFGLIFLTTKIHTIQIVNLLWNKYKFFYLDMRHSSFITLTTLRKISYTLKAECQFGLGRRNQGG